MDIRLDDLEGFEIRHLLAEHYNEMHAVSSPESTHVLDIEQLKAHNIKFYTIWVGDELGGCGALKVLDEVQGEIKSMRTVHKFRRSGVAAAILSHIIAEARKMGLRTLNLETGSMEFFASARKLYEKFGFTYCMPFGEYREDPNSVFMTLSL
jgi:putative acetyltransferase